MSALDFRVVSFLDKLKMIGREPKLAFWNTQSKYPILFCILIYVLPILLNFGSTVSSGMFGNACLLLAFASVMDSPVWVRGPPPEGSKEWYPPPACRAWNSMRLLRTGTFISLRLLSHFLSCFLSSHLFSPPLFIRPWEYGALLLRGAKNVPYRLPVARKAVGGC